MEAEGSRSLTAQERINLQILCETAYLSPCERFKEVLYDRWEKSARSSKENENDKIKMQKWLLSIRDGRGNNLLHFSAMGNNIGVARWLVSKCAELIEVENIERKTALALCVDSNFIPKKTIQEIETSDSETENEKCVKDEKTVFEVILNRMVDLFSKSISIEDRQNSIRRIIHNLIGDPQILSTEECLTSCLLYRMCTMDHSSSEADLETSNLVIAVRCLQKVSVGSGTNLKSLWSFLGPRMAVSCLQLSIATGKQSNALFWIEEIKFLISSAKRNSVSILNELINPRYKLLQVPALNMAASLANRESALMITKTLAHSFGGEFLASNSFDMCGYSVLHVAAEKKDTELACLVVSWFPNSKVPSKLKNGKFGDLTISSEEDWAVNLQAFEEETAESEKLNSSVEEKNSVSENNLREAADLKSKADALVKINDFQKASEYYKSCLVSLNYQDIDEDSIVFKLYDSALISSQDQIELKSKVLSNLSYTSLKSGDIGEAKRYAWQAIALNSKWHKPYMRLALALAEQGDWAEASQQMYTCVLLDNETKDASRKMLVDFVSKAKADHLAQLEAKKKMKK